MSTAPTSSQVYVVGAGIAGMTAALRLLQQGYHVTVFDEAADIGGKFGAVQGPEGIYHEHAYHIFPDWCLNFFELCREIGLDQHRDFEPFPDFHILRPFPAGTPSASFKGRPRKDLLTLSHLGSPEFFWTNVNSGVAEWHDMLLFSYSYLDLLTDESIDRQEFLNRVSVNGYVRSLRYASDMTALLHQDMLLKVFASPSYEVSARTYRTYLEFTAGQPFPHPPFRALKGNVQIQFWRRFEKKLLGYETSGRYRLEKRCRLTGLDIGPDRRVTYLHFDDDSAGRPTVTVDPSDQVIVAIPADRLCDIVRSNNALIGHAPQLLGLAQLRSVQFAALDLYVTQRLELPDGHVTLMDDPGKLTNPDSQEAKNGIASEYGLSLIDNGRFWPSDDWDKDNGTGQHFLSVLVGDFGSISELDAELAPSNIDRHDNAPARIIRELGKYVNFDPTTDIDWRRSYFRDQKDTPLFVNSVGSWEYRPETRLSRDDRKGRTFERMPSAIPNLYLAGDYCRSRIDVVSVEAALVTGINAARAICDRVKAPLEPPKASMEKMNVAKTVVSGWVDIAAARARSAGRGSNRPS